MGDWSHGYAGAMFGPAPTVIGGGILVLAGTAASALGFGEFRSYRAGGDEPRDRETRVEA